MRKLTPFLVELPPIKDAFFSTVFEKNHADLIFYTDGRGGWWNEKGGHLNNNNPELAQQLQDKFLGID